VEPLETRCVLSGNVLQTNLVSDLPGVAQNLDPNLVNPWGISESGGSPFWISDNGAGVSTLYNSLGQPQPPPPKSPLVVSIPTPDDPLGASGAPTGTVFNIDGGQAGGFPVKGVAADGSATSGPAVFLFATEDGTIVGWNPGVNPAHFDPNKVGTYGIIAVPTGSGSTTAVYKGLTIAQAGSAIFPADPSSTTVLYAANFRSGQVEAYDPSFTQISLPSGAFSDPTIPSGYAPFNVQVLGGKVYVTYAKQDDAKHDDVAGPGHGFVDVFNLNGTPGLANGAERLVSRGPLNSPWGLALAPQGFAGITAANSDPVLLVGNFGNGHINAFDAATGAFLGQLKDPDGEPIAIDGLWALKVGNGGTGGASNTVYFTAGLFHESHGLFGSLSTAAPGSDEGFAEAQAVTAALDVVQIDVGIVQKDIANGVTGAQLRQDIQNLNSALVDLTRAEITFAIDARRDVGSAGHNGPDRDALDDLFAALTRGRD
jgi:uncharacterized protein (TIGR03118 family)